MSACRQRKGFSSIASKLSRMLAHVKRKCKAVATQQFDLLGSSPSSPAVSPPFPPHIDPLKRSSKTPPSPCPVQASAYLTSCTQHNSPCSAAPVSPLHVLPHPPRNDFHTHPSLPLPVNPSPLSVSLPPWRRQGEHSARHTLWAVILLALLWACLCVCKEIAFIFAADLLLIVQPELGRGILSRGPIVNDISFNPHGGFIDSEHTDNMLVLKARKRGKSWTTLHSAMDGEMQSRKTGNSIDLTSGEQVTMTSPGRRGNIFALQVMVLVILGGLFHGRFLATCMVVYCILIYFKIDRLYNFKRRHRV